MLLFSPFSAFHFLISSCFSWVLIEHHWVFWANFTCGRDPEPAGKSLLNLHLSSLFHFLTSLFSIPVITHISFLSHFFSPTLISSSTFPMLSCSWFLCLNTWPCRSILPDTSMDFNLCNVYMCYTLLSGDKMTCRHTIVLLSTIQREAGFKFGSRTHCEPHCSQCSNLLVDTTTFMFCLCHFLCSLCIIGT